VLYEILAGDKLLAVVGLNEDAEWEANNEYPEEIVRVIGEAIGSHKI